MKQKYDVQQYRTEKLSVSRLMNWKLEDFH